MDRTVNRFLGASCQYYRVSKGMMQIDVANGTGYSIENVSAFENGRNNNAIIFLWYVRQGLNAEFLRRCERGELIEFSKNVN